jgi:hypothetical protein
MHAAKLVRRKTRRFHITVTPGQKPGYAPTVEDLFRMIEVSGPNGSTVIYNDAGVPTEMRFDNPDVADDQANYTVTITET